VRFFTGVIGTRVATRVIKSPTENTMKRITLALLAGAAVLVAGPAVAQQNIDFSKVEVKTTDLGSKTYLLEGAGGNVTVAVGTDGIIMVDSEFAPMHDKLKAAIEKISPLPIKYLINTHYHGDHTGGDAAFHKDGATIVAQDNIRVRLAAGNAPNGLTGAKMAAQPADGLPTDTYSGGTKTVQVGGRKAVLNHVYNAHTDGDTWVYFDDANVLDTGDTFGNTGRYNTIDFANGGDIRGLVRAADAFLKVSNDQTKIVPGHGKLANKADMVAWREMLVTSRDRIQNLVREGKSEQEVLAANPLADLNTKWAANEEQGKNWTRMVYNSFKRS
jgi:glyoxylase-like metal-dependent hydrolase (beta-lactamase superfamily II)